MQVNLLETIELIECMTNSNVKNSPNKLQRCFKKVHVHYRMHCNRNLAQPAYPAISTIYQGTNRTSCFMQGLFTADHNANIHPVHPTQINVLGSVKSRFQNMYFKRCNSGVVATALVC